MAAESDSRVSPLRGLGVLSFVREPQLCVSRHEDRSMHPRSRNLHLVHIVWATKYRAPVLDRSADEWLADTIAGLARVEKCVPIAIGNADDHAHVLLEFPASVRISDAAWHMKGASSHAWNQRMSVRLDWQNGYWSETLSPRGLPGLIRYVSRQRARHDVGCVDEPWEAFFAREHAR
jgi:REP element-mobilizing transposase RayT